MQRICILGATGSIGQSTLDVIALHPDLYQVVALTAHSSVAKLIEQAKVCQPKYLVVTDPSAESAAQEALNKSDLQCELLLGHEGLCQVAALDEVDTVMAAIVGAAGLMPTLAAVRAGKKVLLANKEALVMCGELFIQEVQRSGALLLPIDSEHNAIFQCLPSDFQYGNLRASGISKILLTGSGGPFLHRDLAEFANITPAQACAHPNWSMGQKISVDSATMMNKGLEFIEAKWLFGLHSDDIQIVLHPQSIIHSMVQYDDGSVMAQMGNPDMRTPIAHCLAYPKRIQSGVAPLDFAQLTNFSFHLPDFQRYPNLQLAIEACEQGQSATTALNASNEVAVEAFLNERIGFVHIAQVNQHVLQTLPIETLSTVEEIVQWDEKARVCALDYIKVIH